MPISADMKGSGKGILTDCLIAQTVYS